jgi:fatty acid desaturase
MKDRARREQARSRAEAYAPRPKDTRLIYVVVAVSLLLTGMAAVGAFYAIDVWGNLLVVMGLAVIVSAAALVLRGIRLKRHDAAHRFEYGRHAAEE